MDNNMTNYYNTYDEDGRLFRDYSHQIEWLTTMHYFDVVLCMGAFYHLDEKKRYKAMEQCLRLLKNGGILVITYINLITVLHMKLMSGLENISEILKCYSMKSLGDSFVYMMPEEIETMAEKCK